MRDPHELGRHDSWEGVRAVVAGFGVSGFAAADNLNHLGASVTALDESDGGPGSDRREKAELLEVLGATVRLEADRGAEHLEQLGLLTPVAGGATVGLVEGDDGRAEVVEVVGRGEARDAEAGDHSTDALPGVVAAQPVGVGPGGAHVPATHSA